MCSVGIWGLNKESQFHIMSELSNFAFIQHNPSLSCNSLTISPTKKLEKKLLPICATNNDDNIGSKANEMVAKGSGTTARGRRLLKVREEKRKREYDRLHKYPAWAKVLEDACKDDEELRVVLGDSIGNPELMRKRVEERVRKKGRDFQKSKTGSVLAFKVSFRE